MSHILIIEDEPFIAFDVEAVLEREGGTSFDFAQTEAEAVDAAMNRKPDLITSDVKLLEGTGPRAVSAIHAAPGDIPVIFITATPEACEPCNPPGRILGKPLDRRAIARAFHELSAPETSS